jgi:hypothetical protein
MSFEQMQAPSESSPVMVDPTMADDLNVLERHLASRTPLDGSDVRLLGGRKDADESCA